MVTFHHWSNVTPACAKAGPCFKVRIPLEGCSFQYPLEWGKAIMFHWKTEYLYENCKKMPKRYKPLLRFLLHTAGH